MAAGPAGTDGSSWDLPDSLYAVDNSAGDDGDSWEVLADQMLASGDKKSPMVAHWLLAARATAPRSSSLARLSRGDNGPVLIVDASAFLDASEPDASSEEDEVRLAIFESLCRAGPRFEAACEAKMEEKSLFHSTDLEVTADLSRLSRIFPHKRLVAIDYPLAIVSPDALQSNNVFELWREVQARAAYDMGGRESVRLLKRWVTLCSRPLLWKKLMLEEIDSLAEAEELLQMERKETVERVEDLARLDAQTAQLIHDAELDAERAGAARGADEAGSESEAEDERETRALLLEGLYAHQRDVRADLQAAQDEFDRLRKHQQDSASRDDACVVDEILLAVLRLCDSQRAPAQSEHDFARQLGEEHQTIREQWLHDFGRLPFRD
jgi:hypothetical protein